MINGRTTVRIAEWEYNIDVTFHVPSQRLEIIIPLTSTKSFEVAEFLFAKRFKSIVIVNEMGQEFTAYDCICIRQMTKIDVITILGQYKTLIMGRNIPKAGKLSFHFEGLEYFFSKFSELKQCELSPKENYWSFLNNNGIMEVVTRISDVESIDSLISLLIKVREYFEYLIDKEILVERIIYSDRVGTTIEILNDTLLMSENACLFDEMSLETPEKVVTDLNQWLLQYELYKEAICIWRKTIYNRQVSDEDIFIWRCKSLELLCALYKPLFQEAKNRISNPRQQSPNLVNILEALNAKHKFIDCKSTYFAEVKKARDVYTHYNPEKHISEREWWNASHLMKRALKVALEYVIGLDIRDVGFFIPMPPGSKEEIRR